MIKPGDPVKVAYQKAVTIFQNGHYRDAANAFQTVINVSRGTQYAKNSQYFLAQSYYKSSQYLLAANAYHKFQTLYPQAVQAKIAAFKEAMSYYKLSPRYDTDQTYTHKAIRKFNLFIHEYPNSSRVNKAGKYIKELRSKLAHKIFHAGQQYLKLDQYKAAIIYYNLTVNSYPGTKWAERALVREIAAYNEYASRSIPSSKRKRYKKAVATYQKYLHLFPHGKHLAQAKENFEVARAALDNMVSGKKSKTESSQ